MKIKHLACLQKATYFRHPVAPCAVHVMRYAPSNETVAMHDHEFSELVLVARGRITHLHAAGTDRLRAGDFFVIHPGSRHGYAELTRDLVIYNIVFDAKSQPPTFLFANQQLLPILYPKKRGPISSTALGRLDPLTLKRLLPLLGILQTDSRNLRQENANPNTLIFAAVIEILAQHCPTAEEDDRAFAIRLRERVLARLASPCRIRDLADDLACSEKTLGRRIRKIYGQSAKQFLLQAKAEKARALLAAADLPLETIAAQTGFHDASHLSKVVRAHYGVPPGFLRKRSTRPPLRRR